MCRAPEFPVVPASVDAGVAVDAVAAVVEVVDDVVVDVELPLAAVEFAEAEVTASSSN